MRAFLLAVGVLVAMSSACSSESSTDDAAGGSSGQGTGGTSGASATGGSSGAGGDSTIGGTAGISGAGGGSGSGGADCPTGCPDGTCWLELDGSHTCVSPPEPPRETCDSTTECCTMDSECTDGDGGRCISNIDQYFGCGGAAPFGNSCYYDQCSSDDDCPTVDGASVNICVPPGALGRMTSTCVSGGCRTDADCTTGENGRCLFGEARTHGTCDRRLVSYCAYTSDPCQDRNTNCSSPQICLPDEDYDGRSCGPPPPMYP